MLKKMSTHVTFRGWIVGNRTTYFVGNLCLFFNSINKKLKHVLLKCSRDTTLLVIGSEEFLELSL
jgi:hypothetical protein